MQHALRPCRPARAALVLLLAAGLAACADLEGDADLGRDAEATTHSDGDSASLPFDATADTAAEDLDPVDVFHGGTDAWPDDIAYEGKYADLEGLEGEALAHELCELVRAGYVPLSYTYAKQLLESEIDNVNGLVHDVYTGKWLPAGDPEFSAEHTWPQSKGATGHAQSDLHHLFPTDGDYNTARSNLPLGEVDDIDWPAVPMDDPNCDDAFDGHLEGCFSVRGWDNKGIKVFEPRDAHKGDAARAIFYFAVRWGSKDCQPLPLSQFDPEHPIVTVATLQAWNALDPPDDAERARNDRVEKWQKVRNPFVDHPELIDRVGFE